MKSGPIPLCLKGWAGVPQLKLRTVWRKHGGRGPMPSAEQLECAVVLAGGLGTRLGNLTADCPKPLVDVKGRPYLEHQLLLLKRHGITKILLLTGYLGEQI